MATAQERAVMLRMAGATYDQIADRTGLSMEAAAAAVEQHLTATTDTAGESAATADLARLDVLLKAVWKDAAKGDRDAVAQALTIMEQRSELLQHLGIARPSGAVSVADRLAALKDSTAPSATVIGLVREETDSGTG